MKFCPFCAEEIQSSAIKCKHCGEFLDQGDQPLGRRRRLTLSRLDSMLCGVCGGFAKWLNLDSTLIRIAVALTIIFTGVIPGTLAYAAMYFIIPEEVVG